MKRNPSARIASSAVEIALIAFALGGTACSGPLIRRPYVPEQCDRPDASGCIIDKVGVVTPGRKRTVDDDDIKGKLATAETHHSAAFIVENVPILSLLDRLTVVYQRFDPFVLERDLARVERAYRARGYYEAHARAGRVLKKGKRVEVQIAVDEGLPVKLHRVSVVWKGIDEPKPLERFSQEVYLALDAMKKGEPISEETFDEAQKSARLALTRLGYAYADVQGKVDVDLVKHEAVATFTVEPGPVCTFGPITFEGLGDLPEKPLRFSLAIKKGNRYSSADLEAAQVTLGKFGVLGSIDIVEGKSTGEVKNPVVPIKFRVKPAALREFRVGFGLELGSRFEIHTSVAWEHKNLFGGLRHFTISATPGIVLNPQTLQTFFDGKTWEDTRPLPQAKVQAQLQQPGFLERKTEGLLTTSVNAYLPVTTVTSTDATEAQAKSSKVVGYLEFAGKAGVKRPFSLPVPWGAPGDQHLQLGMSGSVQHNRPFEYRPHFGGDVSGFDPLTIPSIEWNASLDFRYGVNGRMDLLNPHKGVYLGVSAQLAAPFTGGKTYNDFQVRPSFLAYIPLARKWTLAFRSAFGFLFALNYDTATTLNPDRCDAQSCGLIVQLFTFRGFYSGGTSNRGYPFTGVGPHETVQVASASGGTTPTPLAGGVSLWEASLELRAPVYEELRTAIFFDASNVGLSLGEIFTARVYENGVLKNVFAPHLSAGIGIRYETPVGALRADFGVRIPCAQYLAGPCRLREYLPPSVGQAGYLFNLPLALSIAIGEAF